MKVAVVGTGYVGLVIGACLAETGNEVTCADADSEKVTRLGRGELTFFEPGLQPLVSRNVAAGRLRFTTDVGAGVELADVVFIAVGTPADQDGSADLHDVLAVAKIIGQHMNRSKVVITKSTVPVGTAERVRRTIAEQTDVKFHICSNPEFLKEGAAVDDFMKPDRIVVGVASDEAQAVLEDLYAPFVRTGNPIIFMDIPSAEVTKYAANAMLASRISFMNQIAELCESVGADVHLVRKGIGSDPRIGPAFLFPGPGYGGSCFPKDMKALIRTGRELGIEFDVLVAAEAVNARQKRRVLDKIVAALGGSVRGRRIGVWGLAFKAETDDMRESPAIDVIEGLLDAGATVSAFDPQALGFARRRFGERVEYAPDPYAALHDADALAILTEWLVFRNPDFARIKAELREPVIVDGRNLYDPGKMARLGFRYFGIGRGERA